MKREEDPGTIICESLPKLLLSLANEPTIGLHFIASHINKRGSSATIRITERVRKNSITLNEAAADMNFASAALGANVNETKATLENMQMTTRALIAKLADSPK